MTSSPFLSLDISLVKKPRTGLSPVKILNPHSISSTIPHTRAVNWASQTMINIQYDLKIDTTASKTIISKHPHIPHNPYRHRKTPTFNTQTHVAGSPWPTWECTRMHYSDPWSVKPVNCSICTHSGHSAFNGASNCSTTTSSKNSTSSPNNQCWDCHPQKRNPINIFTERGRRIDSLKGTQKYTEGEGNIFARTTGTNLIESTAMHKTVVALPGQDIIFSTIPRRTEGLTCTSTARSIPKKRRGGDTLRTIDGQWNATASSSTHGCRSFIGWDQIITNNTTGRHN